MKPFNRWVDRFCARHPRFGVGNLIMYLVLGNLVVWLFSIMDTTNSFLYYLYFMPSQIFRGQIWRLVTFIFIPSSNGILTLLFLYFYYFIGSALEREWGPVKFSLYFFSGMLFTIAYGLVMYFVTGQDVMVGGTYIYLSMFFTFAAFYPDQMVLLFFILPVKIKWLAYVDAAFFVYAVFTTSFPLNLLPVVAVLNFRLFCWDMVFGSFSAARMRQRRKTVDFRRAAHQARAQQANKPYRFKCAVCGRTDVDHPELEFRYCSRCAGYHCFCQDHINNHIHFTE